MGQFVDRLQGIAEARALDFPIVSGNVSLYNETMERESPPTPSIGGVGRRRMLGKAASLAFRRGGRSHPLSGSPGSGRSAWLSTCLGREEGAPPPVDLAAERRNGEFAPVRGGAGLGGARPLGRRSRCRPGRDGYRQCGIGATIDAAAVEGEPHGFFFGEDQGCYVVTSVISGYEKVLLRDAACADVPMVLVLWRKRGPALTLPDEAPIGVQYFRKGVELWFPAFMEGSRVEAHAGFGSAQVGGVQLCPRP